MGTARGRALMGGTEAFVSEVLLDDGREAVLKLLVPHDDDNARNEIRALELADGQGCVALYRGDVERRALLLEKLGPSLFDLGVPIRERHEILCAAALQMWRPAPDCGLRTGAEKGRWLAATIPERVGGPSGAPARKPPSSTPSLARPPASRPTTTNAPSSTTATSTSGTRSGLRTATSSSTRTANSPRRVRLGI